MGVLRPLFVSLPTPKDTDQESLIAGYFVALEGMELEALQSVTMKVVKGLWDDKVVFCPRPPELAMMVRKEQRRLEDLRAPNQSHKLIFKPAMTETMEKRWAGKTPIRTDIDPNNLADRRTWPVGSIYVPILGNLYPPERTSS